MLKATMRRRTKKWKKKFSIYSIQNHNKSLFLFSHQQSLRYLINLSLLRIYGGFSSGERHPLAKPLYCTRYSDAYSTSVSLKSMLPMYDSPSLDTDTDRYPESSEESHAGSTRRSRRLEDASGQSTRRTIGYRCSNCLGDTRRRDLPWHASSSQVLPVPRVLELSDPVSKSSSVSSSLAPESLKLLSETSVEYPDA